MRLAFTTLLSWEGAGPPRLERVFGEIVFLSHTLTCSSGIEKGY